MLGGDESSFWNSVCTKELQKEFVWTYASFVQGSQTVVEYADEFHTFSSSADMEEPKYLIVGIFKWGLNKDIRGILQFFTIYTMPDAF